MATVTVEVNGRPYAVGCADGQEQRVQMLASLFDTHVRQVAGEVGHLIAKDGKHVQPVWHGNLHIPALCANPLCAVHLHAGWKHKDQVALFLKVWDFVPVILAIVVVSKPGVHQCQRHCRRRHSGHHLLHLGVL